MKPEAEVSLPADTPYVAVLRMATAGIAARLDFTLEDIEDLKMAVSEASSLVLASATPGGQLSARYYLGDQRLTIEVGADTLEPEIPDPDSFTWQVLSATATDVSAATTDERLVISLTVASTATSVSP